MRGTGSDRQYPSLKIFSCTLAEKTQPFLYSKTKKYSLDGIQPGYYSIFMQWEVEYTDEFGRWWDTLSEEE